MNKIYEFLETPGKGKMIIARLIFCAMLGFATATFIVSIGVRFVNWIME